MTSEVILYLMKNICVHNISNHRKNRLINECVTKERAKMP